MKKMFTILIFSLVLLFQISYSDTLTIVHINDTHSNLTNGGSRDGNLKGSIGGIARAATYISNAKASLPNVLTLHSGDIYIGDLFFQQFYGVAELQLMGLIGFDAMTLGNHEFDLSPTTLKSALDTAFAQGQPFPLLSANLVLEDNSLKDLKKYIQAYTIKNFGNVKVGIFGLTTPSTNIMSMPAPAVIDDNIVDIATQVTASLKSQACDVIILLSHLGLKEDKEIASKVPGINLIVGGHDHYILDKALEVNGVSIVQAGAFYHNIGLVQLEVSNGNVKLLNSQVTKLDDKIQEDPQINTSITQLIENIENTYGKVYTQKIADVENDLNEVAENLLNDGNKDTEIGNLVTDAYRAFAHTEIAIQPGGSTSQKLYKGSIAPIDAFRVVGYGFNTSNGLGFELVKFKVSGLDLLKGLEFGLSDLEENDEFLIQVSGMKYSYNPMAQIGSRVQSAEINSKEINLSQTYSVVANSFVLSFFNIIGIEALDVNILKDTTEYIVFTDYLKSIKNVNSKVEGRIVSKSITNVEDLKDEKFNQVILSPNPSETNVNLNFNINKEEKVKLSIYSSSLKEIAKPFDSYLPIGNHNIDIDLRNYDSGVYIYKMFIGNEIRVGRFVVKK